MPGSGGGGGNTGGNTNANNLAHVLQPRHTLVVTGIFPMKKQVDEFVMALRVKDVNELIAHRELPIVVGINVVRKEFAPDGTENPKGPLAIINLDPKNPGKLHIEDALNKELAEAIYEFVNPRSLKPVVHEGLVTPLPRLPDDMKYPDLHIKGEYWPKEEELVADNSDQSAGPGNPAGGAGKGPMGGGSGVLGGGKGPGGGSGAGPAGGGGSGGILGGGDKNKKGDKEGPAGGGADHPTETVALKTIKSSDAELYERLANHKFNIFHPFGQDPHVNTPTGAKGQVERFGFPAWDQNTMVGGPGGPGGPGAPGAGGPGAGGPGAGPSGGGSGAAPPPAGGGKGPMGGGSGGLAFGPDKGGGSNPGMSLDGGKGGTANAGRQIYDAIVRFVDVDVKPGFTYQYYIQVRIQNPNYNKKHEVVQQLFADSKELVSESWTETPKFTVPGTYHLFAVDQFHVDRQGETDPKVFIPKGKTKDYQADRDHTVLQLHRWFGTVPDDTPNLVGDWAIVERLRVRRGEQIGTSDMIVEIPTWNRGKGGYDMQRRTPPGKGKHAQNGIVLDFIPLVPSADGKRMENMPPFVVDFEGGKKSQKFGNTTATDEAATDVLIVAPDGRLIVRNSLADIYAEIEDGSSPKIARQERVKEWRKRNQDAINGVSGSPASGNGGIMGPK
jgi:hypothetical protein